MEENVLSDVLSSFGASASAIYSFMYDELFYGLVSAIHSFRDYYIERINFDSSYLLRIFTFLEELS